MALTAQPAEALRDESKPKAQHPALNTVALREWLERGGADVTHLDFAPSATGLGVYLRSPPAGGGWWTWLRGQPRALAAFPLSSTLSSARACADAEVGPLFSRWLADGKLASEREAVQLYLLVQRARGEASPIAPYLAVLPEPSTPLWWSDGELRELAGTTLWEAAQAQKRQLALSWTRVRPLAAEALRASGAGGTPPSELEWRWAVSQYWSRAMSGPPPMGEAIVPGLDFLNHSGVKSNTLWTVWGAAAAVQEGKDPSTVVLADAPSRQAKVGDELRLSYGSDRPNDEMLLNYGFTDPAYWPSDVLMVAPPLPRSAEEAAADGALQSRMMLLHARGLEPRVFLPTVPAGRSRGLTEQAAVEAALPTFAVFALSEAEVGAALEGDSDDADSARAGALMLLFRLLQQRVAAMAATGSVEQDEAALRTHDAADRAGGGPGLLPPRSYAALVYRVQQKRLAARYVGEVRRMAARAGLQLP